MMDEHVQIGRKHPTIRLNTTYSYGLDDQEFIVAFEGDSPASFDIVMEASARHHPTRCGIRRRSRVQMSLWDLLDTLGGRDRRGGFASARADGFTPVATLNSCRRELPAVRRMRRSPFNVNGNICAIANRCTHARQLVRGQRGPGALRRHLPVAQACSRSKAVVVGGPPVAVASLGEAGRRRHPHRPRGRQPAE
jgi:hypothetical protein